LYDVGRKLDTPNWY